jgi:hypothetical protein
MTELPTRPRQLEHLLVRLDLMQLRARKPRRDAQELRLRFDVLGARPRQILRRQVNQQLIDGGIFHIVQRDPDLPRGKRDRMKDRTVFCQQAKEVGTPEPPPKPLPRRQPGLREPRPTSP